MTKDAGTSSHIAAQRRQTESSPAPPYAEVAIPLHVSQTFVYRLPELMRELVSVGARVVVPLGRSVTTGFVVALHDTLPSNTKLSEQDIKNVEQVLDLEPLVTPEVIQITRWVSEYYAAPWGEVIKAALPPGISANIEQFLLLTSEGHNRLAELSSSPATGTSAALARIAEAEELNLKDLAKALGKTQASKATRELHKEGLIEIVQRPGRSTRAKQQRVVRRLQQSRNSVAAVERKTITEAQSRVLEALAGGDDTFLQDLLAGARTSLSVVNTLQRKGLVEISLRPVRRDPLSNASLPRIEQYDLTEAQAAVLRAVEEPIRQGIYAAFLLHGVTGSGKTEVYMRAMRVCLELGRSALMLVPEIVLTPVFSRRLKAHFGDQVAIFHSSLSKGERFDEWTRVKEGAAKIVIGTRSAVFAPIAKLGLVIIDEEHESTYRQQDSPQYNGRDTAIVRAQKESAVVILGSATPSLESFHNAHTGKYQYLRLASRIANRPLATARIVDMRKVFDLHKKPRVFSDDLLEAIDQVRQRNEQAIILINRRGYSSFVLCRSCGETIQCPNCDVTLTYHRSESVIVCHYCNHREAAPQQCPNCQGKYIYYVGEGTEQIEAMLTKLFPTLRIARIDRDAASRRGHFEKTLTEFSDGQIDMLVGTQMLAKGHDFPNVTLVGVVSVDAGLALPDFRAAERTFQLLTQVAGRAGRGDLGGQVLIQTYHPNHYALRHACAQDYEGFYQEEIRHRQNHSYPPFVSLASLLVHGSNLNRVRAEALDLRKEMDLANKDRACRILGPAPAPLARLKGEHRVQLLVKSRGRRQLRSVVETALDTLSTRGVNLRSLNLEIDPVSIM